MAQVNPLSGQVSDSSQGLSDSDISNISDKAVDGRSGAEQSAFLDWTRGPSPALANATTDPVAPQSDTSKLSDADFEKSEDARFDSVIVGKSPQEMISMMHNADEDYEAYGIQGAMEKKGFTFEGAGYGSTRIRDQSGKIIHENRGDLPAGVSFDDQLDKNMADQMRADGASEAEIKKHLQGTPGRGPSSILGSLIPDAGANDEVPNKDPLGKRQIQALRDEHISEGDIATWRASAEKALRDENVPDDAIKDYFGDPKFDHAAAKEYLQNSEDWHAPMANAPSYSGKAKPPSDVAPDVAGQTPWHAPMVGAPGKTATGAGEAFLGGLQGSALGLPIHGDLPDYELDKDAPFTQHLAQSAGQIIGDFIPGTVGAIAGGLGGTAVGGPRVGAKAGFFGMGAVPAGMRKFFMDRYRNGEATSAQDVWDRLSGVAASMTKEGTIMAVTGGLGEIGAKAGAAIAAPLESGIAQAGIKAGSKIGAEFLGQMGSTSAINGKIPDANDFGVAATSIIGMHAMIGAAGAGMDAIQSKRVAALESKVGPQVAEKLRTIYQKTELHPADVSQAASEDPVLARELLQSGNNLPDSLKHLDQTVGRKDLPQEPAYIPVKQTEADQTGGGPTINQVAQEKPVAMAAEPPKAPEGTIAPSDEKPASPQEQLKKLTPEELNDHSLEAANAFVRGKIVSGFTEKSMLQSIVDASSKAGRDSAFANWVDSTNAIMEATKRATGASTEQEVIDALPAKSNPAILARLMPGMTGKAIGFLKEGTRDFNTQELNGESLSDILDPYKNKTMSPERLTPSGRATRGARLQKAEDFENWLVSAKAVEKAGQGINLLKADDGTALKNFAKVYESGKAEFSEDGKRVTDFNNRVNKYLADSGVISQDAHEAMVEKGQNYVPTKRLLDSEGNPVSLGSSLKPKNPIKALKGESDAPIISPVEQMVKDAQQKVVLAERNRLMTAMHDMLSQDPNSGLEHVETEEGKDTLDENGEEAKKFRKLDENEISYFKDGKREIFKVSPDIAKAVSGIEYPQFALFNAMAKATSIFRSGVTIAPNFILRHMSRNQISAYVFSKNMYLPIVDFLGGAAKQLGKSDDFNEFINSGGRGAAANAINRDFVAEHISDLAAHTGFLKTLPNVISTPVRTLHAMAEFGDTSTRVGDFAKSKARYMAEGKAPDDAARLAAFDARNLTIDFNRKGLQMQGLNNIIPFINDKTQGINQVVEAFQNKRTDVMLKSFSVMAGTAALWMSNHDDPRYKELSDREKNDYWHVMLDKWEPANNLEAGLPNSRKRPDGTWEINNGKVLRFPKPKTLGSLVGSSVEAFLSAWKDHDPKAAMGFANALKEELYPGMGPVLQTMQDIKSNHNDYFDKSIIPYNVERSLPYLQYTRSTSATSKLISKTLHDAGINDQKIPRPAMVDYAARGFLGNTGSWVLNTSDYALKKLGLGEAKDEVGPGEHPVNPFVQAFSVQLPMAAKSVDEFYQHKKDIDMAGPSLKQLEKEGNLTDLRALQNDPTQQVRERFAGAFKDTSKSMSILYGQAYSIANAKDLTQAEKLRQSNAVLWRRAQLADSLVKRYEKAQENVKHGRNMFSNVPSASPGQ